MKIHRIGLILFCLLYFSISFPAFVRADLFDNSSQLMLLSTASGGGVKRVSPSGELQPFSIPSGKALVIRQINWTGGADGQYLWIPPYLKVAWQYPGIYEFNPGFAVSHTTFQPKVQDLFGNIFANVELYIQGYLIPKFTSLEHINLLLLLSSSRERGIDFVAVAKALPPGHSFLEHK